MDATDLQNYVNAADGDTDYVESCWSEAVQLVDAFVGNQTVPQSILDRAYLETGSELFQRRNAPSGITQFAANDGTAVRIARDPMVAALPLLRRFIRPGIA